MSQTPIQEPPNFPVPSSPRHVTVTAVNWDRALEFTQIFRGFRLAINPAKVMIALLAILLIYTAGRAFDFAWGPQVFDGEIERFQTDKSDEYRSAREQQIDSRRSSLETMLELESGTNRELTTERIDELRNSPSAAYRELKRIYHDDFLSDIADAHEKKLKAEQERKNDPALAGITSPGDEELDARAAASKRLYNRVRGVKLAVGDGIFDSFLSYEMRQFDALVDNTLAFVRVEPVRTTNNIDIDGSAVTIALASKNPERLWQSDTVVGCVANMAITGPTWLFSGTAPMQWRPESGAETWSGWIKMLIYRGLYLASLLALAVFSIIVLAFTGATICRLSALEMSGVERAPLKDILLFAGRRLWVFVKAPVTPFLILLAIGVAIGIVSLVGAIPGIGEILVGVFFILFLAVSFVMMLLLLGILGGFNLLYPTIAVEGSDAFDAMSRSFAYVYARPWRLLLYSVLSLIYGVITFVFISFAVYLVLLLTHTFVGWGTSVFGYNHGWYSGVPKLDTLWAVPQFSHLIGPTNWYVMSWPEFIGSLFLHFWVYLLVTCIGAYVISYYFSTHTIIYLLLRRSVDGQATTEIFTEETPSTNPNSAPPPATPPPAANAV